ncbi:hypothetical protein EV182_007356, partial [Spiromyces aspiralis]
MANGVLSFGEFTLKSGRKSPYFFNAGKFNTGNTLKLLGEYYARAIIDAESVSGVQYDVVFGPAYKGIPLVSATSIALAGASGGGKDVPYAFNRKEQKDHGEGGTIIGAEIEGQRVLIVDDVITAGTAIRESFEIIEGAGGKVTGVVVAIDRQERGRESAKSAIQEIKQTYGIPVITVVKLDSIIKYLEEQNGTGPVLERMREYRKAYG